MDRLFRVEYIQQTPNPQQAVYLALHQDYAEGFVWDDRAAMLPESEAGNIAIKQLLNGGRGHFGPLEHPQITLNCGWFPHSVMQQGRTHRVGCTWDVQSGRYSGKRICDLVDAVGMLDLGYPEDIEEIEEVFYLRQIGEYVDRQGKKYQYTQDDRLEDLEECWRAATRYRSKINRGFAEEHARSMIPFDIRQHFMVSFNARSLMHFLDLRAKADAQLEIQQLCELIMPHFESWMPEIAAWYKKERWGKARLSP